MNIDLDKNDIDIIIDEDNNLIIDFNLVDVVIDVPEIDTPDLSID